MDAKQKASKAEQSLEKVTDELTCTKEELVIAKVKRNRALKGCKRNLKLSRLLNMQEEFSGVMSSILWYMLPFFDWQIELTASSMLVEQSNVQLLYSPINRCLRDD